MASTLNPKNWIALGAASALSLGVIAGGAVTAANAMPLFTGTGDRTGQTEADVKGNGSAESPGIYLNQQMVLFVKQDKEITSGPDAATAFAGATVAALPGAAALPFAGAPAMPGTPGAMQLPAAGPAMHAAAPQPMMPQQTVVQPNPGFLAGPGAAPGMPAPAAMGAPAMPMAPGMPPGPAAPAAVPAGPQLTPKGVASGFTLEKYRSSGWTDDQLRAQGLIA